MDERTYWEGRSSRKSFVFRYLVGALFICTGIIILSGILDIPFISDFSLYITLFLAGIGTLFVFTGEFKRTLTKYSVTENRVIKEEGLVNKKTEYIPYQMVEKISSNQRWYERILKIGNIEIDTGEAQFWLKSVDHPEKVEDFIRQAIGRRGKYDQNRGPVKNESQYRDVRQNYPSYGRRK